MNIFDCFLIGIALSMDAFAVAICKGMSFHKISIFKSLKIGLCFGIFQALMPLIGFFIGYKFHTLIESIDHWIAFLLLLFIAIKMIKDAILDDNIIDDDLSIKTMFGLSIATSIDALIIGISLSILNVDIIFSVTIIGIITFILSFIGSLLGSKVGQKFGLKSQILGGFILIIIGLKILFEHLNLI